MRRFSSENYWEERYRSEGDSGVGSYGKFARFKADIINAFVGTHEVQSVIEFGCGDGNQLRLAKYPKYLGLDVSKTAISKCRRLYANDKSKAFVLRHNYDGQRADLTLSLDVIYHLIEDDVFENYIRTLFAASNRYVIIYSSDSDDNRGYEGTHIKHRNFSSWVKQNLPEWKLMKHVPNRYPYKGDYKTGSFAEFFIYRKAAQTHRKPANANY